MSDGTPEFDVLIDRPMTSRAQDRLQRAGFAEAIAGAIAAWNEDDSLVIGRTGPWGSGKSSIKNMVVGTIGRQHGPNVEVLEFNPRRYSGTGRCYSPPVVMHMPDTPRLREATNLTSPSPSARQHTVYPWPVERRPSDVGEPSGRGPAMADTQRRRRWSHVLWLLPVVAAWASLGTARGAEPQVRFDNSCEPGVQAEFIEGLTLLHCFEYPETTKIFAEIIERDPGCAMAYWGAAMSLWHPLWAPPSEADLARGAALLKKTAGLEMSDREAGFIDALKAFFFSTDTATHRERAGMFEEKMSQVHADHLEDPEAALFYALALLASADPHDKSYAHQYKAAAILNWVYASRPQHPGVLHYLIHSYDFPGLAYLGLHAAETYADAAPNSTHAQHMPSHIFTRLGLWERSISSNHASTHSAAEYTERAHLPGHYDEGLHSMDYLMYAMLQTARDDEARALLAKLSTIGMTDTENFKVAYTYAAAPARYALERREWEEASKLVLLRPDFPWDDFGWALSIHHFARGIGAARSGHLERARQEHAAIEKLRDGLPSTTLPYWREEVQVQAEAVESWIAWREHDVARALRLASAAADREDAVDKHPVTPGEVLPARELYADMLLEMKRYKDSLEQYEIVLRGSPNRLNALLGAANAASGVGDASLENRYRVAVQSQTRSGNKQRFGLTN